MQLLKRRELATAQSIERQQLIEDIRRAEQDWKLAEWKFQHALGEDHVDYAIFCLEAAEKKLGMLLKQAKGKWSGTADLEAAGGAR